MMAFKRPSPKPNPKPKPRGKAKPKLPHILSESSLSNSSMQSGLQAQSTSSGSPSQESSVWNWENFPPPSPPDFEFFERRRTHSFDQQQRQRFQDDGRFHVDDVNVEEEDSDERPTEYDYFDNRKYRREEYETEEAMEAEREREEVQSRDSGNYYSARSSSKEEEGMRGEDGDSRSETGTRMNFGRSMPPVAAKPGDAGSSAATYKTGEISLDNKKMVTRRKDLKEVVDAIEKNFANAAAAGNEVSEMLEIGRDQLDRSFSQLKKSMYHSSSVLGNHRSIWTSKRPSVVRCQLDAGSLDEPGGPKTLCSILQQLRVWEEKLYEDVKRREGVRIDHEKKLSTLRTQEYKEEDKAKLDKTKASIEELQSVVIVTSQAVSTTSTSIIGLRDSDLVPQLVQLCQGFMYMWRSMNQYHEIQNGIVQQVQGLLDQETKGDSTSELHRQAARDLESAVTAWHSSFCRLIEFHRAFIRFLYEWFTLSLISVSNDNINGNRENSGAYAFCKEWKLALEGVPDAVASGAIRSFINVVHVISVKQTEELKMKKGTETASKKLEKNIEKFSKSNSGLRPGNGQVLGARDPLAEKKSELAASRRRVEEAVEAGRARTLYSLQTGLLSVFQALTCFSALYADSLERVCTHPEANLESIRSGFSFSAWRALIIVTVVSFWGILFYT